MKWMLCGAWIEGGMELACLIDGTRVYPLSVGDEIVVRLESGERVTAKLESCGRVRFAAGGYYGDWRRCVGLQAARLEAAPLVLVGQGDSERGWPETGT